MSIVDSSWTTALVLILALGASVLGVWRIRARAGTDTTTPGGARRGVCGAEIGTVALTLLTAYVVWPIVYEVYRSVRGELLSGARLNLVAVYLTIPVPLVVGGWLGWRRGRRRRRDALAMWRSAAWGVLIAGLMITAVAIVLVLLVMYEFAHSDWQF